MATALPSARRGLDAQKQHAGLPALDTQPSAASIRLPKGAAPKVCPGGNWSGMQIADSIAWCLILMTLAVVTLAAMMFPDRGTMYSAVSGIPGRSLQ